MLIVKNSGDCHHVNRPHDERDTTSLLDDDMSFDFPQQKKPRKGGVNGGAMLLLIIVVLFFFMRSPPAGTGNSGSDASHSDVIFPNDGEIEPDPSQGRVVIESRSASGKKMPSGPPEPNGDWSIEGIGSNGRSATRSTKNSSTKKVVGQDGWSLEELPTKKKDPGFNLKGAAKGNIETAEKSDWSIEDVNSKSRKTKDGDWSLEEVNPKRDK